MSKNFAELIALITGVIVFIYCVRRIRSGKRVGWKSRKVRLAEKAKKNGCVTTAVVWKDWCNPVDWNDRYERYMSEEYVVIYKYKVGKLIFFKRATYPDNDYPYETTVYYRKLMPMCCALEDDVSEDMQWLRSCIMTLLFTFLSVKILLYFLNFFVK